MGDAAIRIPYKTFRILCHPERSIEDAKSKNLLGCTLLIRKRFFDCAACGSLLRMTPLFGLLHSAR